jgi:hypothetical protein
MIFNASSRHNNKKEQFFQSTDTIRHNHLSVLNIILARVSSPPPLQILTTLSSNQT